ncbi:hypothetical protein VQL36_11060 [Chengkuizengella sp. SCS-71B]|uniref:hypothetical protein n=1 Tax=Chengkuizengella sp. SCS-71B TaxID=3115290 RepID=UPI0032C21C21
MILRLVPISVPFRINFTPILSVESVQVRVILVLENTDAVKLVGSEGFTEYIRY